MADADKGQSVKQVLCAHADQNGQGAHWKNEGERCGVESAFRCVRCGIPATDAAESLVQPGVLLTVHLPMTDAEGRTVEWCRQHGGPVKP